MNGPAGYGPRGPCQMVAPRCLEGGMVGKGCSSAWTKPVAGPGWECTKWQVMASGYWVGCRAQLCQSPGSSQGPWLHSHTGSGAGYSVWLGPAGGSAVLTQPGPGPAGHNPACLLGAAAVGLVATPRAWYALNVLSGQWLHTPGAAWPWEDLVQGSAQSALGSSSSTDMPAAAAPAPGLGGSTSHSSHCSHCADWEWSLRLQEQV